MVSIANRLAQSYKEAWEHHDTEILREIFDENIRYQEKPNCVLQGIEALQDYWIVNSQKQRNVSFSHKIVHGGENYVVLSWQAYFISPLGVKFRLVGNMFWKIRNSKIVDLKESFNLSEIG